MVRPCSWRTSISQKLCELGSWQSGTGHHPADLGSPESFLDRAPPPGPDAGCGPWGGVSPMRPAVERTGPPIAVAPLGARAVVNASQSGRSTASPAQATQSATNPLGVRRRDRVGDIPGAVCLRDAPPFMGIQVVPCAILKSRTLRPSPCQGLYTSSCLDVHLGTDVNSKSAQFKPLCVANTQSEHGSAEHKRILKWRTFHIFNDKWDAGSLQPGSRWLNQVWMCCAILPDALPNHGVAWHGGDAWIASKPSNGNVNGLLG